MKQFYCILISIFILFGFVGCKKSLDVTAVTSGLSFDMQIICGDTRAICNTVIEENEKATYKIISPDKIKDFSYVFENSNVYVSFKGLEYNIDSSEDNIFCTVNSMFEFLRKNKPKPKKEDKLYLFSGKTQKSEFELTTSESGLPIRASIDDIEIIFKNVTVF